MAQAVTLSRDPAKHREWQDRSRAKAMAKPRKVPTDHRRQGQVKPVSDKRRKAMEERRVVVRRLLREHPYCQAGVLCGGRAMAQDVHERYSRARGGSITDERHGHMMTVCRQDHDWITTHPAEAERLRLALPSWHVCPPVGPC